MERLLHKKTMWYERSGTHRLYKSTISIERATGFKPAPPTLAKYPGKEVTIFILLSLLLWVSTIQKLYSEGAWPPLRFVTPR
ncbi:MAG TPA: hypothetical protein DCP92_10830 [Nitrospiraceae bacterium]|nr:hypothetical protein [Nitrospiraceae bacterium]